MKYIIAKKDEFFIPIILPPHAQHIDIAPDGMEWVSAGFCFLGPNNRVVVTSQGSSSLGLQPHPRDASLLHKLLTCNDLAPFHESQEPEQEISVSPQRESATNTPPES